MLTITPLNKCLLIGFHIYFC